MKTLSLLFCVLTAGEVDTSRMRRHFRHYFFKMFVVVFRGLVKLWSSLTLLGSYQNQACAFRVLQVSRIHFISVSRNNLSVRLTDWKHFSTMGLWLHDFKMELTLLELIWVGHSLGHYCKCDELYDISCIVFMFLCWIYSSCENKSTSQTLKTVLSFSTSGVSVPACTDRKQSGAAAGLKEEEDHSFLQDEFHVEKYR